jgi:hypothetical protein
MPVGEGQRKLRRLLAAADEYRAVLVEFSHRASLR